MVRPLVGEVGRLQRLAVFEAAARLGSFTAAAAELGMTQPAVTRHIRALERSLGTELFVRTANRSGLSSAGRTLWGHVAAGFDVIEGGLAELSEAAGTFVLATHPGVAQQWLVPRLDGLSAAVGDPDLRLWLFDRDDDIAGGGFDAAIRVGDGDFAGLSAHHLFEEIVRPVAAVGLAESLGLDSESTPEQIAAAPLVHMDDGDHPWMSWSDWMAEFGLVLEREPRRVLFHNYPMVVQQALAGRGVALGWKHLVDDLVAGGALTPVGPEVASRRAYYLAWPAGEPTEAVRSLIDWLDTELGKGAG